MNNYFHNLFNSQRVLFNIEPTDPPIDVPGPGGGGTPPPTYVPGLLGFAGSRYTCNLAVTEELKVVDLINDVIFPSARMFTSQGYNGKLRLQNKKPVSWGLSSSAIDIDDTVINIDDVRDWIADDNNFLLIDPYTTESEIHTISSVSYSTAQNSVTLTSSANITVVGFAGASGSTPATATVTIDDPDVGNDSEVVLDGITIPFNATGSDTVDGIASFIATAINVHPKTARRFIATSLADEITIKGKFGAITLAEPILADHTAPVANPTTAPVGTATASGSLAAGDYKFAYSYVNHRGQTLLSPVETVTLTAGQKITVTAITPPSLTTVNWYIQPQAGSVRLRLHSNNDGSSFVIDSLPLLTATLPPDFNRTGCEVMRILAVFSDRDEARTSRTSSNVLRATYEWLLGNRTKSVNRIDLKYRDAFQDYRLIELRISDNAHIAKIKKTSNLEVNGQAIDNTFQATRIGIGLLAEHRDADFFYTWKASREALMLEEGDVVAITDSGSGVINLPVMIEALEYDLPKASMPRVKFTGRKYSSSLYDDSVSDRVINTVLN